MKILMVCLGNICRSPLAEGILQTKAQQRGLDWEVDSAGTSGWHNGEGPDERSVETARKYGLDISQQKSRKLRSSDIDYFDRIYVMDDQNLNDVLRYCYTEKEKDIVEKIMSVLYTASETKDHDTYCIISSINILLLMWDDS